MGVPCARMFCQFAVKKEGNQDASWRKEAAWPSNHAGPTYALFRDLTAAGPTLPQHTARKTLKFAIADHAVRRHARSLSHIAAAKEKRRFASKMFEIAPFTQIAETVLALVVCRTAVEMAKTVIALQTKTAAA